MKSNLSGIGFLISLAACAFSPGESADSTTPTVLSNTPVDNATGAANGRISATFSEAMDPTSLTSSTFTLTSGTAIPGTVIYTSANSTAVFWPAAQLERAGSFTATITTGAISALGVALATEHAWSFTGNTVGAGGLPVNLRTAGNYAILAKAGIGGTTATVTGDLGVSPAAATYITGFSLSADPSNTFSTSAQVIGRIYAADYVTPTPAHLTQAVSDMELAYTDAAERTPDVIELAAGNIGGMTLVPGVYRWSSGVSIPANLTLEGSPTSVWIFQIAQTLTMSTGTNVILTGGALPKNVFWQVSGGPVTIGTTAHLEGVVLTQTAVTLAGASLHGRLLAQTAVTIDGSTVVAPVL